MLNSTAIGLGLLFLFSFGYVHQRYYDASTPVSRLDLLHTLLENGSWNIDPYHTNTADKAVLGNHYYSDKAPGVAALASLPFAVTGYLLSLGEMSSHSSQYWLITSWVCCFFSQALPAAMGGALLFVWLAKFVAHRFALLTATSLFLGSLPLPYSTILYSHSGVIGLLCITLWALDVLVEHSAPCAFNWRNVLAGFCVGLALASEYTAGLVAVGLLYYVASCRRCDLVAFVSGAIPPLLLIPIYSMLTMGNAFALPYSHQASFLAMKEGIYGIKWPDLEYLSRLMIGPTRGLVFWTPFLVMALAGALQLASYRPWWLSLVYYLPVLHIVVISGRTWDWQAGYAMSARYMAPILPLLALPCALGLQHFPRIGSLLAAYSFGIMTLATLTDACPDSHILNPIIEIHLPSLLSGDLSPNMGMVVGLSPHASVALYYFVLLWGIWWLWRRLPDDKQIRFASAQDKAQGLYTYKRT